MSHPRIPLRGWDHSLYRPPEALRLCGVSDSTHDCESDIRALGSAFRCFRLGSSACLGSRVARRLRIVRSRIAPRAIEPGAGFREGPICQAAAQGRSGIIRPSWRAPRRTLRARARWRRSRRWQACRALSDGQRGCGACGSPVRQPRRHLQARPLHRPWLPQTSASGAVRAAMPPPRGGSSHGCCPSG